MMEWTSYLTLLFGPDLGFDLGNNMVAEATVSSLELDLGIVGF